MEPVIQYAMTSDGVSIAFSTLGEGPPVVILPVLPLSHLQVEWQMPGMREFLEQFATSNKVIRFDARGLGLSDRGESERSLEAHLRDLEAVVDKIGLDRFALFAASYSGPVGIRYAALHPERVSRLILWCTHAYHGEVVAKLPVDVDQQRKAVNQLAGVDRDLFIRTYLHRAVGWTEGDTANRFVDVAKQSIDPSHFFENLANHAAFDARADLPNVSCPTIVLHRPAFVGSHVDVAKGLAARMPDARLVLLEGQSIVPFIGDTDAVLGAALPFLAEDTQAGQPNANNDSAMRTLLYTDVENHSAMIQRLGDALGREVLRQHERLTREALKTFGGEELRTLGDGFLASFRSTQLAVRCAIELQRSFDALEPLHGEKLKVRVGINAGEPIADGNQLHGNSVEVASQIGSAAAGGEILASLVVRELVAGKGFHFDAHDERTIPGGDAPIQVYQVQWREAVPR
jgi:class 3 adenylate cyclase/pimeloyl-ACP methyl ester carboxylesterase